MHRPLFLRPKSGSRNWILLVALALGLVRAAAQGTAFGFQGQLTDGPSAANGVYDLRFTLWDAATAGEQQGPVVDAAALTLTNGLFQATLDFGPRFNGAARWLEIGIRTNGALAYETLPTRQPVSPTPYAIHAATAISAQSASTATTAATASALSGTVSASQVTGVLAAAQVPELDASRITGGVFTGNGAGLTNIAAAGLRNRSASVQVISNFHYPSFLGFPTTEREITKVAVGEVIVGLTRDGRLIPGSPDQNGLLSIASTKTGIVDVAVGVDHILALDKEGQLLAWGDNSVGQCNIPSGLSNIVKIAAGYRRSGALTRDGTLRTWGFQSNSYTNIATFSMEEYIIISRSGARVGYNSHGTLEEPSFSNVFQRNIVDCRMNSGAFVYLLPDGTVRATRYINSQFIPIIPHLNVPIGLSNVVAIESFRSGCVALKSNGEVVGWGNFQMPSIQGKVISISGGLAGDHLVIVSESDGEARFARLDSTANFQGGVSAQRFLGDGSEITNLVASNVGSGVFASARIPDLDASKITTGIFDTDRVPDLNASKVVAGVFNAARIPDLDASKIVSGTLSDSRIPGLDGAKITSGILPDARIGTNIPRLDGFPVFSSDIRLSDKDLLLRGGTDKAHGLGWFGGAPRTFAGVAVDGPVLYGNEGGALGSTSEGQQIALSWESDGDVRLPRGSLMVSNGGVYADSVQAEHIIGGFVDATDLRGSGSLLTDLNASQLASGTVPDARLGANLARLDGNPVLASDLRLSDHDLFLRAGSDTNHGLGWFGGTQRPFAGVAVDGPVLYGYSGGALGSTRFGQTFALRWDQNADSVFGGDVTIPATLTVSNALTAGGTLSVAAPAGNRAANLVGSRTGDYRSAVVHIENMSTNSNASPALRINGRGTSNDGALNVSADSGRLARFGNATDWVVAIENAGHVAATSFVTLSDRNKKAGFADVDVAAVLEKVAALSVQTWHYTNDPSATPHLGPMAQDFHAAFGLGASDRSIATVDADGVALAAIQGLHHRTRELAEALEIEQAENRALRRDLESLRGLVEQLVQRAGAARP